MMLCHIPFSGISLSTFIVDYGIMVKKILLNLTTFLLFIVPICTDPDVHQYFHPDIL